MRHQTQQYGCYRNFLSNDCKGLKVYANPPYNNKVICQILSHVLRAKEEQPAGTSVLLVLPVWWEKPYWAIITELPELFQVVERYEAGEQLFTSPNAKAGHRKHCGPTRWPVVVVYLPPAVPQVDWERVHRIVSAHCD